MLGHESGRRSGRLRFPNHSDAAVPKIEGDDVDQEERSTMKSARTDLRLKQTRERDLVFEA